MRLTIRNLGDVVGAHSPADQAAFIGLDGEQGEICYRFDELDRLASGVARGLHARGYAQGERIALLAANSVEFIAVLLGILRAGLVAVPVNHRFPQALVEYVIADSGARLVFCDEPRASFVPVNLAQVSLVRGGERGLDAFLDAGPFASFQPRADEPALILYTSGSTGKPKGVVLSHAAQLWVVRTRLQATPLGQERPLIAAPLYHMNALALALLSLACGATTVLMAQFNAVGYIDAIQRYRCTWLTAVPPMIAMMLQEQAQLAQADLSSVRVIRMGSAPVSASLLHSIHHLLPNARVINAYGTTEGGPVVFGQHPKGLPSPALSVGHAHPQVQLRLRDPAGRLGEEGVLELKSPGLMIGYHRRPDLPAPIDADGFYSTGDVFQRDRNGFYTYVGRRDDMFVSGGENIYPGEVEKLLERHPAVQQACVVAVVDDIKGFKPMAFVVLRQGTDASEAQIKAFTLEHAPAYQHPRRIWFVDALPLATTNKIDRTTLLQDAHRRLQAADE
ncbi:acetyl-CoA synthetase [Pseudomonas sp. Leaf129]|uniref:class I adenylate-forming enzyme family protein n=1 Tax=Pseudomonas sp. Leaf129 TaxID=1736268 RepID=UPI0007024528|nr:class I adenylate-forming enzyme family protein [Pseudomonas sp. Leaf129]KQQ62884.1 acetyl-CoA synthetase [Pseudomonas sp. Leaf129]